MLINSNTAKGRCPICGAANCGCGTPSTSVPVDERIVTARPGGPLQKYELRPGLFVQLTEEDARRRGLLKMQEEVPNKMRVLGTAHDKGEG